LLRNAPSWEAATKVYRNITSVPVQLVWGDKDWAKQSEREYDSQLIPQAETATIGIYAIGLLSGEKRPVQPVGTTCIEVEGIQMRMGSLLAARPA
jgi:hypothetical protein